MKKSYYLAVFMCTPMKSHMKGIRLLAVITGYYAKPTDYPVITLRSIASAVAYIICKQPPLFQKLMLQS